MKQQTLFIGFDLGDGETLISILNPNLKDSQPESLRMPTTKEDGKPIITAYAINRNNSNIDLGIDILSSEKAQYQYYANFKELPSKALKKANLSQKTKEAIYEACKKNDIKLLKKLIKTKWDKDNIDKSCLPLCIREFVNAIFENKNFQRQLYDSTKNCDKICVIVGHPTKWEAIDIALYKAMLENSILGQGGIKLKNNQIPISLLLEKESRAAFLSTRQNYNRRDSKPAWKLNKYTLLCDIGSSTTDVTAISGLEVDSIYDSGKSYLGARLIDQQIYHYCRTKLAEKDELNILDKLFNENSTYKRLYILACRIAKEQYFSSSSNSNISKVVRVNIPECMADRGVSESIRIKREEMSNILSQPIQELGNVSWPIFFRDFLIDQKKELGKRKKNIDRVILTGSAANMGFISDICEEVFNDKKQEKLLDHNPGKRICYGLSMIGRSNEKSINFQQEANQLIEKGFFIIIQERVALLADKLSPIIADIIINDIAFSELKRWKKGSYVTLNGAIQGIKNKCTENNIQNRLTSCKEYSSTIEKWVKDDVIGAIHNKLLNLCHKYGLSEMTTSDVDISNVPIKSNQNLNFDGLKGIPDDLFKPADILVGIIAVVSGIVTFFVMPSIISIILSLIISISLTISTTLAIAIATALAAVPGPGWILLASIAGLGVIAIAMHGYDYVKSAAVGKMMSYNLPQWVRDRVSESKIESALQESRYDVRNQIEDELKSSDSSSKITNDILKSLSGQIKAKVKEIKYIIESK